MNSQMSSYNDVTHIHDVKRNTYFFFGNFGNGTIQYFGGKLVGLRKYKNFFIILKEREIKIFGFFLIDLKMCIEFLIHTEDRYSRLNMRAYKNLLELIKQLIPVDGEYEKYFDFQKLKTVMKFEPLEHQKIAFDTYESIKYKLNYRGLLLDAAVGSGKL